MDGPTGNPRHCSHPGVLEQEPYPISGYTAGMRLSVLSTGALVALTVSLLSCSVQSKITVGPSGAATIEAAITLPPATKQAWKTLKDLDPSLPSDPLEPALWKKGLGASASVSTAGAVTTLGFAVSDVRKLFPGWDPTADVWDITLDRATVRRLAGLSSWSTSPALDSLIPGPQTQVTEAEYRDLLVYLLGEPATASGSLVDGSTVQLTVVAPRDIRKAEGAALVSGRTAVYRWPLVKVLVLSQPLRLRLDLVP